MIHLVYKYIDKRIVWYKTRFYRFTDMILKHVENEAGDLWSQNREVIRQYDKKDPEKKSVPVFPEVFIQGTKMFHLRKDTVCPAMRFSTSQYQTSSSA